MKIFNTTDPRQTKKLGELLAEEIISSKKKFDLSRLKQPKKAEPPIVCLEGELGSGKTTFTQGLLKGLGVKGPYTSPTFVVIKQYQVSGSKYQANKKSKKYIIYNVYHVDAYRVTAKNVLDIGWEEIIADKSNVIIVEWANKIRKIIPKKSLWIKFKWLDKNKRKIIVLSK